MLKTIAPMFHVPDVRRTVDWYRAIGFDVKTNYGDADGMREFIVRDVCGFWITFGQEIPADADGLAGRKF